MVVSDHGVATGYRFRQPVMQHFYNSPGIFLAIGPDVHPARDPHPISMYRFTPTVLSYFGLPVAADFEGTAAGEIFRKLPRGGGDPFLRRPRGQREARGFQGGTDEREGETSRPGVRPMTVQARRSSSPFAHSRLRSQMSCPPVPLDPPAKNPAVVQPPSMWLST